METPRVRADVGFDNCIVDMGPECEHRDLFLALSEAESYQVVMYTCSVTYMYAVQGRCPSLAANRSCIRYSQNIPDPFFGPKGVRSLLFIRGCTGYDTARSFVNDTPHRRHRFTALSGMYFSLQYLSLSDAVVLKYLAPILTGFSGAIFLKESLSLKGTVAGREHSFHERTGFG